MNERPGLEPGLLDDPTGSVRANMEVADATLKRRQKQRNYSHVQSDRRGTRRMEASAIACEAKALQHSFPNEALSIVARARCPLIDLGSAANAF